ncbi:MAG: histidine phosphatase family protein, partial [Gemmatimonadota bacterium]|nr:histidine phosphatase family protein [Gemmatimonadota bacterium]
RLRSVVDTISLHHSGPGKRVLIVAHQVIVLCFRYLLEGLDEEQILAIDREGEVANCGVTCYGCGDDERIDVALKLREYNFVAPLEQAGAPVTSRPDMPVGVK